MTCLRGLLVHSTDTLTEFAQVFSRNKFDRYISLEKRIALISEQEQRTLMISVKETVAYCRDPKDDKFLSLALAAKADCIVTGDQDLLILHPFKNIPILSPADFITEFNKH